MVALVYTSACHGVQLAREGTVMATHVKKLRNCNAYVNINSGWAYNSYELVSYETPVALLGMVDGEIVDNYGEIHEREGMALLLDDMYDCSMTTMQHVRKFVADYIGVNVTIADIRKALKTDNILCNVYGGDVAVYLCEWA
jgi:hypothetical protein